MLEYKEHNIQFEVQNIDARIILRSKVIDKNDNLCASSRWQKYNINDYNNLNETWAMKQDINVERLGQHQIRCQTPSEMWKEISYSNDCYFEWSKITNSS